ncbi:MAG: VanZ family protein [Ruminococcus sp.]
MGKNKKMSVIFWVLTSLTCLYIFIIWIHSTMSASDSTVESTAVMNFLQEILRSIGLGVELTDFIVRKSAHFCEFALLGFLTICTFYIKNKKILINLTSIGFICLCVAIIDEIIQIYSPGRSCQVSDVVLDFSGALAGICFYLLIFGIYRLIKKGRNVNKIGKSY